MHERTEGNPFVLEEMLREAIDRGDVFRTADGWDRAELNRGADSEKLSADTILLRFARLDPAEAQVLQAAAVLGRTFEYATLLAVADLPEATVQSALAIGVAQQMIEEISQRPSDLPLAARTDRGGDCRRDRAAAATGDPRPRGRRALRRRRERATGCSAPPRRRPVRRGRARVPRRRAGSRSLIRVCRGARGARARTAPRPRPGRALATALQDGTRAPIWTDGKTAAAETLLAEGIPGLVAANEVEAAGYRLILARAQWEQSKPDAAREEFEEARRVLEQAGPSPELALAYMRLSGLYKFEFAADRSLETAEKAVEVAKAAAPTSSGSGRSRGWPIRCSTSAGPTRASSCSTSHSTRHAAAATPSLRTTSRTTTPGRACTR